MDTQNGRLYFAARIDSGKLASDVAKIKAQLKSVGEDGIKQGARLENAFGKAGKSADDFSSKTINARNAMASIGALVSLSLLAGFAKEIANVRGEWQKYEAVLTNTLGSNQDAKDSLDMIGKYGAKTNFQVNELTDSFVKLASQGFKPTRDEMASLGDLAASKAKGFNQLTEAIIDAETFEFERLKDFGIRASKNGDLIQFTFKGIKTSVDASAEAVRNYILSLGQLEGVKGSTDAISKTIVGLASNFGDAVNQMMNSLGESQEGLIAGSISAATDLVNNYERVVDVLKVLIATYGAYKAATIAVAVTNAAMKFGESVQLMMMFRKELGLATAAQQAFNTASKANPYGLVLAGISLLISSLIVFSDSADEAAEALAKVNETVNEQKAKIETLTTIIKSETAANADRAKAIKELNDLMPDNIGFLDAQTLSTKEGKEAIDEYIKSIRKKAEMEQLTSDLQKNLNEQDRFSRGDLTAWEKFKGGGNVDMRTGKQDFGKYQAEQIYALKEQEDAIKSKMEATMAGKKVDEDAAESAKTVAQQLLELKNNLVKAEAKLNELRKSDSTATPEDVKKQSDLVERLKAQREILTGIKDKEKKNIDELKTAQEALEAAIKSGDRAAIDASAKRVNALEVEKRALEELVDLEMQRAWRSQLDGQSMDAIPTIGPKPIVQVGSQKTVQGILYEVTAVDKTGPVWKKMGLEIGKLKKKSDDWAKDSAKMQEDLDQENADKKRKLQEDILNGARQLTGEIIAQSGASEGAQIAMQGFADSLMRLATGDPIGAMVGGFLALGTAITGTADLEAKLAKPWEEFEDWVALSNRALERYIKLRDEAIGEERYSASNVALDQAKNDILEAEKLLGETRLSWKFKDDGWGDEPINTINKAVNALEDKLGLGDIWNDLDTGWTIWSSQKRTVSVDIDPLLKDEQGNFTIEKLGKLIEDGVITDGNVIASYDAYIAKLDELKRLEAENLELLTATMARNISDSVSDGFKNGLNSAADFADTFEGYIRGAIDNGLKILSEPGFQEWYKDLATAMESGGGLDETEIKVLRADWDSQIADDKKRRDETYKITGMSPYSEDATARTGSSKGLAAMTQDAGEELNGRFTAIQGHTFRMADSLDILKANSASILSNVIEIKDHTDAIKGHTSRLETIQNDIGAVKVGIDTINTKGITLKN